MVALLPTGIGRVVFPKMCERGSRECFCSGIVAVVYAADTEDTMRFVCEVRTEPRPPRETREW